MGTGIASEQAVNRLTGYPTLGPDFPQNRESTRNVPPQQVQIREMNLGAWTE
jgi:hypothetical protein